MPGVLNSLTASFQVQNESQLTIVPSLSGASQGPAQQSDNSVNQFGWTLGSGGASGYISAWYQEDRVLTSGGSDLIDLASMSGKFTNFFQWFSFNKVKAITVEHLLNFGANSGTLFSGNIQCFNTSGGFFGWLQSGSAENVRRGGVLCKADEEGFAVSSGVNSNLRIANTSGGVASYRITIAGATTSG